MNEYNEYTVEEKKPILKTLKLILIVILIIALFVLLIWLIKGNNNENNNENESPLVNQIFYNNIERMKDAAESYFTLERLPQKEGDKITLTLEEMINKNLVLPLTDKNNKTCSTTKSYVEVVKLATEYQMKIFLSCGSDEDYIIVYMGCYDYCKNFICEKKEEVKDEPVVSDKPSCSLKVVSGSYDKTLGSYISNVVVKFNRTSAGSNAKLVASGIGTTTNYKDSSYTVTKNGTTAVYGYVKDSNGDTARCSLTIKKSNPVSKKYQYQYEKKIEAVYSDWSDWSDNKTYKETDNIVWGQQEFVWNEKNGAVKAYVNDLSQPVWKKTYTKVIGSYKQYLCDGYTYYRDSTTSTTYQTGEYVYVKTVTDASSIPDDTATTKYVLDNVTVKLCSDCSVNPTPKYSYKVYTRTGEAVTSSADELKAICNVKEYDVPIYGLEYKLQGYVKVETYIPVYHTKTRTLIKEAYTSTLWSNSSNDQTLINQGYVYTGVKKEVK